METKEKDKKYNITLGIMIMLFLIIVGIAIAWGLGYIHFGKQTDNNNENAINNEEDKNENNNDNGSKLGEAYVKYSDVKWQRDTYFDAANWGENVYIYGPTGKVVVETVDWETRAVKSTKTIENIEGTPKYVAGTMTCGGYDRSAILTEEGNVYLQTYISNDDGQRVDFKYEKLELGEKIVDIAALSEMRATSCFYQKFYFLTETGRLINSQGETYEERNGDYKTIIGNIDMPIYVYKDNTIGYILVDNCDDNMCKETKDKFTYNGKEIVVKNIFITQRTLDVNSKEFEVIGQSPTYTAYILTDNGELLYINDYEFNKLTLNLHSKGVKNIEKVSDNTVKVNYLNGTSKVFDDANIEI